MGAKSNFKGEKPIFRTDFPEICYLYQKIFKYCYKKNFAHYLQTVLRLTKIQKQETPKPINCNFCCSLENLKDIGNRNGSIGIAHD